MTLFALLGSGIARADAALVDSASTGDLYRGVSAMLGDEPPGACAAVRPVRYTMDGAQVVDAFVTGAAVRHGSIGRTVFGTATVPVSLLTEGALDVIVGALTRRSGCVAKTAIDGAIGASAIVNAVQTR